MTSDEIEALALAGLPEEFFRLATRGVFLAYRSSFELCEREYADPEAENLWPYARRGKLEFYLRDLAERFPEVEAAPVKSEKGWWNHTEVRGKRIVLTENAVPHPCAMIDPAGFRLDLAAGSSTRDDSQPSLFEFAGMEEPDPVDPDSVLYAVLLHSRSRWPTREQEREFGYLPGSAYVAFPSPDLSYYAHTINLFARFPEVVAAETPPSWDEEARVNYMRKAQRRNTG